MKEYCVIPDVNVIIDQFSEGQYARDPRSKELIEYCLLNETFVVNQALLDVSVRIGKELNGRHVLTSRSLNDLKHFVRKVAPRRLDMGMQDEIDGIAVAIGQIYKEHGFSEENNRLLSEVAQTNRRYQPAAWDVYSSQMDPDEKDKINSGLAVPDVGDLRLLGFAAVIKKEYEKVFVASSDADITGWEANLEVVKLIESKYGIKTGTPSDILVLLEDKKFL